MRFRRANGQHFVALFDVILMLAVIFMVLPRGVDDVEAQGPTDLEIQQAERIAQLEAELDQKQRLHTSVVRRFRSRLPRASSGHSPSRGQKIEYDPKPDADEPNVYFAYTTDRDGDLSNNSWTLITE